MFFDGDFESIANGWNDGQRMAISSSALSSVVVEIHEATHGRIFNQTADGQLHKLCIMASKSPIDLKFGGLYSNASKTMFLDSRTAHEAGATYLAIQALSGRGERKEAFRELTKDYKDYYKIVSAIIDPNVKTSWLRFAFAWTLIHWAFHSNRISTFFETQPPALTALTALSSPTARLREASRRLKRSPFARRWVRESLEKAKAAYSEYGKTLWDIESETAWATLGGSEDVQLFENLLTSHAGDWLLNNIEIESYDFRSSEVGFGDGFENLLLSLGLTPEHIITSPGSVLDKGWIEKNVEMQGISHSLDIIEHNPVIIPIDMSLKPVSDILDLCVLHSKLSTHCTVLSDSIDITNMIIFAFRRHIGKYGIYHYEDIATIRMSADVVPLAVDSAITANSDLDLMGLFRARRETIIDVVRKSSESFYRENNGKLIRLPALKSMMIYIDGPWTQVYSMRRAKIGARYVALIDDQMEDGKPVSLHVATGMLDLIDFFVTLKPRLSGHRIKRYEDLLASRGKIMTFSIEDHALEGLTSSLRDAWHIWKSF